MSRILVIGAGKSTSVLIDYLLECAGDLGLSDHIDLTDSNLSFLAGSPE